MNLEAIKPEKEEWVVPLFSGFLDFKFNSSDYEKAQVLIAAATSVKDEDLRKTLVEVPRGIRSGYERGSVLSAASK